MAPNFFDELKHEIYDLRRRYPNLTDEDLFVLWYLFAHLADGEDDAAKALTGSPNDKDADAVLVDDRARTAFIVQSKYRKRADRSEQRADVVSFASLAGTLRSDKSAYEAVMSTANPLVRSRLDEVRDRLKRGYELQLIYVTSGRFTPAVSKQAEQLARKEQAQLELIDHRRLSMIMEDYRDGVAPPVATAELTIDNPEARGAIKRIDPSSRIESWVFSTKGSEIGALFKKSGVRIFARNIRGFLGPATDVNHAMRDTLAKEPDFFWYFNNGVTIVCDDIEIREGGVRAVAEIQNPQIINGQQTTRTLAESPSAARASVLVRAIKLPREKFDLVSRIVVATNHQNKVSASDLRSNDRIQIELERALRRLGYNYLRKRMTKSEGRAAAGSLFRLVVKKDELAQAVAACELQPHLVRSAKEKLFEEGTYERIFSEDDPYFYLTRFLMARCVTQQARGNREKGYSKWLVVHAVWEQIGGDIGPRRRAFVGVIEANEDPAVKALRRLIDQYFTAVLRFYRANRGHGTDADDVYTFFKRKHQPRDFKEFLRKQPADSRKRLATASTEFRTKFAAAAKSQR